MSGLQYTYASMLASLQDWHTDANSDFVAALPEIMNKGETMVAKDMDLSVFDDQLSMTITSAVATATKPSGLVRENSIFVTPTGQPRRALRKAQLDFVRLYEASAGAPLYYAERDDTTWALAPTPNETLTAEVCGIVRPQTLVDVGTTNTTWLSKNHADVLWQANNYYACLYLKKWQLAGEALGEYNRLLPQARAEAGNQRRVTNEDASQERVVQNMPAGAAPPSET